MHPVSAYWHHLNPPADESALQALEAEYGVRLPSAFKTWYRNHDGQSAYEDWQPGKTRWLPLAEIPLAQQRWQTFLQQHFGADWASLRPQWHDVGIESALFQRLWLPFMEDSDGSWYCLDFAPTADGQVGQVLYVGMAENLAQYDVLYESADFASWLNELLAAYQNADFEPELPALCADYWQQGLQRAPEQMHAPASQSALHALQRHFSYPLPEALLALYRLFAGEQAAAEQAHFLAVDEIVNVQQQLLAAVHARWGEHWVDVVVDNGAQIQKLPYHPLWLPFYAEAGGKALYCYDPVPGADGVIGQVLRVDIEHWQASVFAEEMHEALRLLLQQALTEQEAV